MERRSRLTLEPLESLRYGENPGNSPAALVKQVPDRGDRLALHRFNRIEGSEPSYTNLTDLDRAVETIARIAAGHEATFGDIPLIAVIVKHGNACGAATVRLSKEPLAASRKKVLEKAISGDHLAAFGGTVITNFALEGEDAQTLRTFWNGDALPRPFDLVIAPAFDADAILAFKRSRGRCRLYTNQALLTMNEHSPYAGVRYRQVRGGFLKEEVRPYIPKITDTSDGDLRIRGDSSRIMPHASDLVLAWAVGSSSTSNTITVTKDEMLLANAAGGVSRVGAVDHAINTLIHRQPPVYNGLAAYSDAFFPHADAPQHLQRAGIEVVLVPSGSVNDDKVGQLVQERLTLVYLPPHARGFYGH